MDYSDDDEYDAMDYYSEFRYFFSNSSLSFSSKNLLIISATFDYFRGK